MNCKKLVASFITAGMIVSSVPLAASAKGKTNTAKVKSIKVTNLPAKALTLKKGKSKKLKVKVVTTNKASKKVIWKTSNKKIIGVKNGTVKALKKGKAKVTVTSQFNKKKKVIINVTVGTPVSKVKLNKATLGLTKGKTGKLKVTVSPKNASNKKIVWTTSNKKVVAVDKKGKLKALAEGTVTIKAIAEDGSGRLAKCKVVVVKTEEGVTPSQTPATTPDTSTQTSNTNDKKEANTPTPTNTDTKKEDENKDKEDTKTVDPNTLDDDGDGLTNLDEKALGTDPNKKDTDGDGLTDYEEVMLGTDPLTADEFDKETDTDGDGLTDYEEVHTYKTEPKVKDTDGDGLSDGDEVNTYKTDPLKKDTDGDTLSDGFEIANGLDPLKVKSDGETNDSERKIEQILTNDSIDKSLRKDSNVAKPSITGKTAGDISESVYLNKNTDTASKDDRSVVGDAVEVEGKDKDVKNLNLSFDLSDYTGDKDPLVVSEITDKGTYNVVDSKLDDNKLTAELDQAGTYCVVDADKFLKNVGVDVASHMKSTAVKERARKKAAKQFKKATQSSKNQNNGKSYKVKTKKSKLKALNRTNRKYASSAVKGQADVVFAIDTTGSMEDEINNVATNVQSFATSLSENYNVNINYSLIDFKDIEEDGEDTTKVIQKNSSNWYDNVDDFKSDVANLVVDGGGDEPESDVDALETARRLNYRSTANKFVILITDASYKEGNRYDVASMSDEINALKKDGIVTSVVTSDELQDTYKDVYEKTGGIYCNIYDSEFSTQLLKLADMIGEKTSDGTWVILRHGYQYVKVYKDDEDQDHDGVKTVDELGEKDTESVVPFIKKVIAMLDGVYDDYDGQTEIAVYDAKSDPTKYDTDLDGISDSEDTAPWKKGLEGGIVGKIKLISVYGDSVKSGHAFYAYTSYVNDDLDFSGLVNGWQKEDHTKAWSSENIKNDDEPTDDYQISRNEALTIGNGSLGTITPDGILDGKIIHTDTNGVNYNMEVYKHLVGDVDYSSSNTYIESEITDGQLRELIDYLGRPEVNYWSPIHNCATVAVGGWNKVFGDFITARGEKTRYFVDTPVDLHNYLEEIGGKSNWNMDEELSIETAESDS